MSSRRTLPGLHRMAGQEWVASGKGDLDRDASEFRFLMGGIGRDEDDHEDVVIPAGRRTIDCDGMDGRGVFVFRRWAPRGPGPGRSGASPAASCGAACET